MQESGLDHFLSGSFAGLFITALLHPLDLIKTRLHVQEQLPTSGKVNLRRLPYYHGLFDACRTIVRLEGWLGFYQGLGPNVVGNTASWGVYMYYYNRCKDTMRRELQLEGSQLYIAAATMAGTMTTLLLHPIFTVKTRMQLQMRLEKEHQFSKAAELPRGLLPAAQRDNYAGPFNAVRRMIAEEGILSLYRGLGPSLLLVSHGSIQFLAYEQMKLQLSSYRATVASDAARTPGPSGGLTEQQAGSTASGLAASSASSSAELGATDLLLASASAKICAIIGTYPYQVIRSCMQQRALLGADKVLYRTTTETVSNILRIDGLPGFYRGIWAHILRSTPQATITLLVYEYCQRVLSWRSGGSSDGKR